MSEVNAHTQSKPAENENTIINFSKCLYKWWTVSILVLLIFGIWCKGLKLAFTGDNHEYPLIVVSNIN